MRIIKIFKIISVLLLLAALDFCNETFYLCNRPYEFAKHDDDMNTILSKTHLCFATEEGYFAALNDDDETAYFCIEVLENEEGIGFVEGEMPSGIYGQFYEDYNNFQKDAKIKIIPFNCIEDTEAELWILDDEDEDGAFARCVDVQVVKHTLSDIRVKVIGAVDNPDAFLGSAVMQGMELVAFVTEYIAETCEFKCISAEILAVDLCRKIYELKQRSIAEEELLL